MKNDTCPVIFETTQIAWKEIDTIHNHFESIQTKSESLMNRFKQKMIRFIL